MVLIISFDSQGTKMTIAWYSKDVKKKKLLRINYITIMPINMSSFMSSWEFNEPNKVTFPTKVILFLANMKNSSTNLFILFNMI